MSRTQKEERRWLAVRGVWPLRANQKRQQVRARKWLQPGTRVALHPWLNFNFCWFFLPEWPPEVKKQSHQNVSREGIYLRTRWTGAFYLLKKRSFIFAQNMVVKSKMEMIMISSWWSLSDHMIETLCQSLKVSKGAYLVCRVTTCHSWDYFGWKGLHHKQHWGVNVVIGGLTTR